jgi:hypothetical protein
MEVVTMERKMTKKGAMQVTSALDNLAQLFESDHGVMGIPVKVAKEFALRCDMLSDFIEREAGIKKEALTGDDPVKEPGFNPEEVGEEKKGPLEDEPDEGYMKGEFSQQENRELRERVEDGDLGPNKTVDEPQKPQPGKQGAEEEVEEEEVEEKASGKKAQEEEEEVVEEEEKESNKKASHCFDLFVE